MDDDRATLDRTSDFITDLENGNVTFNGEDENKRTAPDFLLWEDETPQDILNGISNMDCNEDKMPFYKIWISAVVVHDNKVLLISDPNSDKWIPPHGCYSVLEQPDGLPNQAGQTPAAEIATRLVERYTTRWIRDVDFEK